MQRLAALRRGLGSNQISDALGGGQVHLAMQKGAAGEFAGLGLAQAGRGQRLHHPSNDAPPTMQMKLRRILTCVGSRTGEPQH